MAAAALGMAVTVFALPANAQDERQKFSAFLAGLPQTEACGAGDVLPLLQRSSDGKMRGILCTSFRSATTASGGVALSIKHDFGAVGDGVADDGPAFVAAALVGGNIYVDPGTYKIGEASIIQPISNTRFYATPGTATLTKTSTANSYIRPLFRITDATDIALEGLTLVESDGGVNQFAIVTVASSPGAVKNIRIVGNTIRNFPIHLYRWTENVVISGNTFLPEGASSALVAIATGGTSNPLTGGQVVTAGPVRNVWIDSNYFKEIRGEAVDLNIDTRNSWITNNYIEDTSTTEGEAIDVGGFDTSVPPETWCEYVTVSGNVIRHTVARETNGIRIKLGTKHSRVIGNIIENPYNGTNSVGIHVTGHNNVGNVGSPEDLEISGNQVTGFDYSILASSISPAPTLLRISITNNILRDAAVDAIQVENIADGLLISGNNISTSIATTPGIGIELRSIVGFTLTGNTISGTFASSGIRAQATSSDGVIANNVVYGLSGYGFHIQSPRTSLTGNIARNNNEIGFILDAAHLTVTGNEAHNNAQVTANAYGFYMTGLINYSVIVGNKSYDTQGVPTQNGFTFVAAADRVVVNSNLAYPVKTTSFNGLNLLTNSTVGVGKAFDPVIHHGAVNDGVTDATAAIHASQADCAAAGGGVINISGYRLYLASTLTVAAECPIVGSNAPYPKGDGDYTTIKSALLHGSGTTVNVGRGGMLKGVAVLASNLPAPPTTYQQGVALIAGMAGTGITITGSGAVLEDVQSLGFATAVSSTAFYQITMRNFRGDAKDYCVFINGSSDHNALQNVNCWPFLTLPVGVSQISSAVSGAADNGAGKIRLTVASTASFATTNTLFVSGVLGYTGANLVCDNATVVNATTVDCPNSQSTPTATGAVTSGSNLLVLTAENPSIAAGQTITDVTTGGNIPGATTVLFVAENGKYVYMSAAATGTGAADSLSFANAAYTSGGNVTLDNLYRAGTAFHIQSTTLMSCVSCSSFGWKIGYDFLDSEGADFTAAEHDDSSSIGDNSGIGVRFRGTSYRNRWTGPYLDARQGIVVDSSAGTSGTNLVSTSLPGVTGVAQVFVKDGRLQLADSSQRSTGGTHRFLALSTADAMKVCGDFPATGFYWQNAAAYKVLDVCPGTKYIDGTASRETWSFATNATLAAGITRYAGRGTGDSTAENNVTVWPVQSGTLHNLKCRNSVAPGGAETHTITARSNFASQPLTVVLTGAGRNGSDTTNIAPVTDGQTQNFMLVASGAAASTVVQCSAEFNSP
jgi:hypothetical protein